MRVFTDSESGLTVGTVLKLVAVALLINGIAYAVIVEACR